MPRTLTLLAALFFLSGPSLTAQLVVAERPVAPREVAAPPAPADERYVLLPGEWAAKDGAYYYVRPRYARQLPGRKYVPGRWKKVSGGWQWRPGEWR